MEQLTRGQRFRMRKMAGEPWYYHATKLKRRTLETGGDIIFEDALSLCKEVWLRDAGSCQYEIPYESHCNGFLGMHHVDENPLNNVSTNLKMACNKHHKAQHEPAHLGHKHSEKTKALLREQKLGKKVLRIDLEQLKELNDAGYTKTRIAVEMGIARCTVRRNMERYGIESKSTDGRSHRSGRHKRDERGRWRK